MSKSGLNYRNSQSHASLSQMHSPGSERQFHLRPIPKFAKSNAYLQAPPASFYQPSGAFADKAINIEPWNTRRNTTTSRNQKMAPSKSENIGGAQANMDVNTT